MSLGLRPIKTHNTNYKMRNNQCVCWASLELGCRRPVVLSERSCMGVRDSNGCERPAVLSGKVLHGCERPAVLSEKVLHWCERPAVLSEKFCMGVRDPRCNPKSFIAQEKTRGHVYHLDLELSDRSRG